MKFRKHRGSFEDSMATALEVETIQDIKKALAEDFINVEELRLEDPFHDVRNGWNTYTVIALINNKWCAVGFTNGIIEK